VGASCACFAYAGMNSCVVKVLEIVCLRALVETFVSGFVNAGMCAFANAL